MNTNGNTKQKIKEIEKRTLKDFKDSRQKGLVVKDKTLKQWALRSRPNTLNFKASSSWIELVKGRNNIVSRKITHFNTPNEMESADEIKQRGEQFVAETKIFLETINPRNIFNSDQTSFKKEMGYGRTLEIRDKVKVFGKITSKSATTHSHTLQPTIAMDGSMFEKSLLCLQEPNELSENVRNSMFKPRNLHIVWSKSGK